MVLEFGSPCLPRSPSLVHDSRHDQQWIFPFFYEVLHVVFLVSWLLPVTVPVRSPFLYIVFKNRKEVHRVLDSFLVLLSSFSQEVPACAVDDASVQV